MSPQSVVDRLEGLTLPRLVLSATDDRFATLDDPRDCSLIYSIHASA
ncbi:MAG: hypothetical protein AAGL89_13680 [Pseudomonadota bacterium]